MSRRKRMMEDLDQDIRDHIERETQDNIERGMPPDEARYAALRKFGNVARVKEDAWELWSMVWLEQLWQDIRYGLRMLAKNPGLTSVAVLTLALGIGPNTAIFTLIDGLLLRSLPVEKPYELVLLGHGLDQGVVGEAQRGSWELFSYDFYRQLHDHNLVFQDVCAFGSFEVTLSLHAGNMTMSVPGKVVSGNYFSLLGVRPLLGRMFTPEDDRAGATPTAVISYRLWSKQFSGDSSAVGKTVEVNGTLFTIVGVTRPEFFGETLQTDPPEMWLPLSTQPQLSRQESLLTPQGPYWLDIIGRLKPGVTFEQAQAIVSALHRGFLDEMVRSQVSAERWEQIKNSFVVLTPGARGLSELRENFTKPLYILLAAVGLILLIACANVANLLLARATARHREVSVRLALGAGRSRLVRQFLTESVLLAMCGGAAGLLFAKWGTTALVKSVANGADYVPLAISPDARVLGFTLGVCFLTGILFGLVPSLRFSRESLTAGLKGGTIMTAGGGRRGPSNLLVVSQVAVSLFLLIGAGLFVRALQTLENQDWGFARDKVLVVHIDPKRAGYKPEQLSTLYQQLLSRVDALPGVRFASLALYSWLSDMKMIHSVSVPGYTAQPDERTSVQLNLVGPRYFETEGMSLQLGREFDERDTETSPHVAIVNEAFVRRFIFGENPISKTLRVQHLYNGSDVEVVGVAKNARYNDPGDTATEMVFLPVSQASGPLAQFGIYVGDLEVRAAGNPAGIAGEVRSAIAGIDKNLPVDKVTTLNDLVEQSLHEVTLITSLASSFGVLAMLLASVGLYGVMSYAVARRTNEIGIRMALGAGGSDVLGLVVRQGFKLTLAGVIMGIPIALALARFLATLPIGIKPADALTFVTVPLMLTAVSLAASYVPARRATKVAPMIVLRHE